MGKIIIGTTPTIKYTYKTIDVANIQAAYFTIKKNCSVVLEKTLAEATVGEDNLSWLLSQEETLAVGVGDAKLMCNCLLSDGTRVASTEADVKFVGNHKSEVI